MGYKQNFGPSRKGAKHGKDMISRIMSNADTVSPLDNSVQHLKGMKGAKDGTKDSGMYRKSYMKGDSYAVPADKLKGIQKSEGLSREESDPKPKKSEVKKEKFDKDPVKHFKSFGSKVKQMTAKNPYAPKSVRNRKFAQLQKNLRNSSM